MRTAEEYATVAIDSIEKSTQTQHELTMTTLIQTAQVFAVLAQAAATRELVAVLGPIVAREKAK